MPGSVGRPRWCWRVARRSYDAYHRFRSGRLRWRIIKKKRISVQARAIIIRLALIARYGGVWADATLWCHRPLSDWLGPYLDRAGEGYFSFHNGEARARSGESLRFTSWFLAAQRNHHIVRRMLDAARTYWTRHSHPNEYFWLPVLVNRLYDDDARFRAGWDAMPRFEAPRGAPGPRYFAPFTPARLSGVTDDYRAMIASGASPVYKLRHRRVDPLEAYDRIRYLFATLQSPEAATR